MPYNMVITVPSDVQVLLGARPSEQDCWPQSKDVFTELSVAINDLMQPFLSVAVIQNSQHDLVKCQGTWRINFNFLILAELSKMDAEI